MDGETLASFEWAIILLIVLGYLIYDLRKTKREIREAKEREAREREERLMLRQAQHEGDNQK
ncbi:MAG: hypothetical protein ACOVVK_24430 [Elsteraceae bacterium]